MHNSEPSAELYLDLLKKALSYSLWEEPGLPIERFNYRRPALKRGIVGGIAGLFKLFNLQVAKIPKVADFSEEGKGWPWLADTMIGMGRLDNIQYCIENVLKDNIPGDLIETGVWRGGACILMRAVLAVHGNTDKRVFVADSFEGLPEPDTDRYPQDKADKHHTHDFLRVTQEEVEKNFERYGHLDEQVVFLRGWFKNTLPKVPTDKFAVMRLDGDMYESTMDALVNLYPKLEKGGYCIIDDYALKGCRQAVDDYREKNEIDSPIKRIDWTGIYWRNE